MLNRLSIAKRSPNGHHVGTLAFMLEDHAGDIIQKARTGYGYDVDFLARLSEVPPQLVAMVEQSGRIEDLELCHRLSYPLHLDGDKLWAIAHGWVPPEIDLTHRPIHVVSVPLSIGSICRIVVRGEACLVADPGSDPDRILHACGGRPVQAILITHTHRDHIGALDRLVALTQAPVFAPAAEKANVGVEANWIDGGERFPFADVTVLALAVPGHTPGGTAYWLDGVCYVGDSLFAGSTGRGFFSHPLLRQAIKEKILKLPDDTVLLPGHGPITTVGEEKAHNPFF